LFAAEVPRVPHHSLHGAWRRGRWCFCCRLVQAANKKIVYVLERYSELA
jgi:hypothetical protein